MVRENQEIKKSTLIQKEKRAARWVPKLGDRKKAMYDIGQQIMSATREMKRILRRKKRIPG